MAVYLLHFDRPISPHHTSQHYIGFSHAITDRLRQHINGTSKARLVEVAHERGIGFRVVRVWQGGRQLERSMKSLKNAPKFCPCCSSRPWQLLKPNGQPARELKASRINQEVFAA